MHRSVPQGRDVPGVPREGDSLMLKKRDKKPSTMPPKPKAPTKLKEPKVAKPRTPLKDVSAKTAKRDREYRELLPLEGLKCYLCPQPATERHHIYTKKHKPALVKEKINLLPLCSSCHTKATGNEASLRETLRFCMPGRMKELDLLADTVGKEAQIRRLG